MNNYLDNNYKNDDKNLKKMRNNSIKKQLIKEEICEE